MGADDAREEMARVADQVHPAYGYAVRRLGYYVMDTTTHLFTAEQIAAWNEAVDDWLEDHPG